MFCLDHDLLLQIEKASDSLEPAPLLGNRMLNSAAVWLRELLQLNPAMNLSLVGSKLEIHHQPDICLLKSISGPVCQYLHALATESGESFEFHIDVTDHLTLNPKIKTPNHRKGDHVAGGRGPPKWPWIYGKVACVPWRGHGAGMGPEQRKRWRLEWQNVTSRRVR